MARGQARAPGNGICLHDSVIVSDQLNGLKIPLKIAERKKKKGNRNCI